MNPPASPSPGRWPTLILAFATAVGVPGSLIAAFKNDVPKHPVLTVFCVLIWWLLVLIAGLVTDVWSMLRSRWVDRLADVADEPLQALFSRYRRRYLDWLGYRHRDFDVKGLTTQNTYNLELEQVFVDLTIQPPPPGGTPADPIRTFPKELTGRRSIWDYLTSESFTDHLALIGAPGSGKTTLLKKIALQMTGRRRPKIRQTLPILLFLREHTETILAIPAPSLADVASADLVRKQSFVLAPAAWFKSQLDAGCCLVLLDGLDEVASQEIRQKVIDWVETQFKAFPKNRFLISSRPHGYRNCPVSGVTVLEIQPFNRDQVRQFIGNWYLANEIHASGKLDPGVEMKAREGAEDLLRRLGNSQTLTDLAVNPLLLTMIATVHRFRSSLPGRRVELYSEICEVFLGKRQQSRGVDTELTPAQKQRVLQPLAYQLMSGKKREIFVVDAVKVIAETLRRVAGDKPGSPEAEFLKDIENSSGLLLERESGIYSFAHLAFQEYLAAMHIRENGLAGELINKVADSWWHEVIRLYGAQGDASGILAACLSSPNPSVSQLSLAIDCVEEAREIDPEWRVKTDSLLKEGVESLDPDRFRLAAETLLARRLRSMVAADERTFDDPSYISHAEYQLFLDEKHALAEYHQPDHWLDFRFPKGQASTPVVGMRSSDAAAFCDWLTALNGVFIFRLPLLGEIEHNGLSTAQDLPVNAEGFWTAYGFERFAPSQTILPRTFAENLLRKDLSEEEIRLNLDTGGSEYCNFSDNSRHRSLIRDLVYARELTRDLTFIRNLDHVYALDLENALANAWMLEEEFGVACMRNQSLIFDLEADRNRHLITRLALELLAIVGRDSGNSSLRLRHFRWMLRVLSLHLSTRADIYLGQTRYWYSSRRLVKEWVLLLEGSWTNIYKNLVLLEARIDGVVPAVEGIRIVKERRT